MDCVRQSSSILTTFNADYLFLCLVLRNHNGKILWPTAHFQSSLPDHGIPCYKLQPHYQGILPYSVIFLSLPLNTAPNISPLTSSILIFEPFLSRAEFILPGSGCAENWPCHFPEGKERKWVWMSRWKSKTLDKCSICDCHRVFRQDYSAWPSGIGILLPAREFQGILVVKDSHTLSIAFSFCLCETCKVMKTVTHIIILHKCHNP